MSFPTPGDLPNPGTELESLKSSALPGGLFNTGATWEAQFWERKTELEESDSLTSDHGENVVSSISDAGKIGEVQIKGSN